jgi:hypothetical protein
LSDTVSGETQVSPIQIFSEPTEPPVIAANRCMPSVCAVPELSSEALTWCTTVRDDMWTCSVLGVVKSGWKPSRLLMDVGLISFAR